MIITDKIKKEDLQNPFTKAVVDIKKEVVSVGCELHIDCAEELISNGSKIVDLWGFNFYSDCRLDFISLINIRPPHNRSMEIKDEKIRQKIGGIVKKILP